LIGVELLVEIQFLDRQDLNKTQIARSLRGVDRKTVRKCLAQDIKDFDKDRAKWPSVLDPYKRYLHISSGEWPELTRGQALPRVVHAFLPWRPRHRTLAAVTVRRLRANSKAVRVLDPALRDQGVPPPSRPCRESRRRRTGGHFGYIVTDDVRRPPLTLSLSCSVTRGSATLSLPRPRTWSPFSPALGTHWNT
jgi:hypothetical protein